MKYLSKHFSSKDDMFLERKRYQLEAIQEKCESSKKISLWRTTNKDTQLALKLHLIPYLPLLPLYSKHHNYILKQSSALSKEGKLLMKLNHDNIIKILEINEDYCYRNRSKY